jgi:cation diffusion facilitator CzcD-associated flavoprotein CzcO
MTKAMGRRLTTTKALLVTAIVALLASRAAALDEQESSIKSTLETVLKESSGRVEFCVVGAGAAGLQLAQHFQSVSASYIVLERASTPGSFYETFPRHGQLISINKKYTGRTNAEFNLRHDWNSILTSLDKANGTDFPFTDYSDDYFPTKNRIHAYFVDFASKYDLKIAYNTEVKKVVRSDENSDFHLSLNPSPGFEVKCGAVVWAGGLGTPRTFKVRRNVAKWFTQNDFCHCGFP